MRVQPVLLLLVLLSIVLPMGAAGAVADPALAVSGMVQQTADDTVRHAQEAVAGRNWSAVLAISRKGVEDYPDNAELYCLQGYAARKTGDYASAVRLVSEGIHRDPRPVRFANRAYAYLALGNRSAALADADAGIALNATYATNYGVRALALQGAGRNAEAVAAADTALFLDPENAHYWHVKGIVLTAAGNCSGARQALERSLELDPGYDLPYPGFPDAGESLAGLNATCTPLPSAATPVQSPAGAPGVIALAVSLLCFRAGR